MPALDNGDVDESDFGEREEVDRCELRELDFLDNLNGEFAEIRSRDGVRGVKGDAIREDGLFDVWW